MFANFLNKTWGGVFIGNERATLKFEYESLQHISIIILLLYFFQDHFLNFPMKVLIDNLLLHKLLLIMMQLEILAKTELPIQVRRQTSILLNKKRKMPYLILLNKKTKMPYLTQTSWNLTNQYLC